MGVDLDLHHEGERPITVGQRAGHRCSFTFSLMSGVTKLAGDTRIRSWVSRSSAISLGPATPISLMATEHWPRSSRSGGANGPGPEKRTQAGYVRAPANTPRARCS